MTKELKLDEQQTIQFLLKDYDASGIKGQPEFMMLEHETFNPSLNKRRSESRHKRHKTSN